jgi:hypothetical protein
MDQSASIVILTTIAVDPVTGVIALAWGDTRGSVTNEEVNHYGVFLDPRVELAIKVHRPVMSFFGLEYRRAESS